MTQAHIARAIGTTPHLVLKVASATFVRIVSVTPDDETLQPVIVFRPYEGGEEKDVTMSEFLALYPDAELGLPEIKRGDVYQTQGGVRKEVLAAVFDEAAYELMLVLRPDNGSEAEEVAASAFLAAKPERIIVH